jgi:hypothetical protein
MIHQANYSRRAAYSHHTLFHLLMPTTRPEKDQATQPVQSDEYQPIGRQEAPTNSDALYGGNADDNSGSGGNARPSSNAQDDKAAKLETDPANQAEASEDADGGIAGGGVSSGTGVSGGSIGQVNL